MPNDATTNKGYPLPELLNSLRTDLTRIRNALQAIDADIFSLGENALFKDENNKIPSANLPIATNTDIDEGTATNKLITPKNLADKTAEIFPVGLIAWFAAPNPPIGFLVCNGASLSRKVYANLFNVIHTVFGSPNSDTFQLPDLRDEFVRGVSGSLAFGVKQGDGARQQISMVYGTGNYTSGSHNRVQFGGQNSAHVADINTIISASMTLGRGGNWSSGVNHFTIALANTAYYAGENRPRNIALLPCIKY